MNCPVCDKPLATGVPRNYETLSEHVCQPNGPIPDKPTLVCHNPGCVTHGHGFWGIPDCEGAWYEMRETGISVTNVPDLVDFGDKKKEEAIKVELEYDTKRSLELLGKFRLYKKEVFEVFKGLIDSVTCFNCKGTGRLKEADDDGYLPECPKCKGWGVA